MVRRRRAHPARLFGGRRLSADYERSVALCIVSTQPDMAVVKGVSAIFERIFRPDMHLDVLFVSADQEEDLKRVCRSFYPR